MEEGYVGRILAVSELYHPYGGAELATHLVLKLLKANFDITVVTGATKIERIQGVNYIYSRLLDVPTKIDLWVNLTYLIRSNWFRRLIERADVIYVPRISYPIIPIAKRYGKKVVVHLHNYQPVNFESMILYPYEVNSEYSLTRDLKNSLMLEMLEHGDLKRALASSVLTPINRLCRSWLAEADTIVCVSRRQSSIILRELPELAGKIRVVYNPLPEVLPVEKELSYPPSMLYMGGDMYTKGFHIFLRAGMRLSHTERNIVFIITGRFGDRSRQLFNILNRVGNFYKVLGYVPRESLLKLYSESYALLFPSIWEEPLPYAVLESMLTGTIPIASRVGGVPEIVQGTYAERTLFEAGNVEEFVDRIESVLAMSNEQIVDAGFSLREAVLKRYNPEVVKRDLIKVFLV
jgi:glycosyltransferase involved in cell wall biosynthesis